ncbi:hypothetical protein C6W84_3395 [Acinetobacter baumannii]|nr:hypothetical protein C6W84_3395 [Acinetobacter baumannii]
MSSQSPAEGLQFPIHASIKKQSTSLTGQEILSEALSIVDNKTAQQILAEKIGEKIILFTLRHLLSTELLTAIIQLPLQNRDCIRLIIFLIITAMVNTIF